MFGLLNSNENALNEWKRATKYEDISLGILLQFIEKVILKTSRMFFNREMGIYNLHGTL